MRLIDADALVGGTYYVSQNDRFVGYTQQDIDDTPTVKLCENAVSREAVLNGLANIAKAKAKSDAQKALMGRVMFFTEQLPSVKPTYTDEEIDKAQAVEQAYVDKMVELAVEEIKERYSDAIGKMKKAIDEMTEIHSDGEFYIKNVDAKWIIGKYLYGAEMSGGGEDENNSGC